MVDYAAEDALDGSGRRADSLHVGDDDVQLPSSCVVPEVAARRQEWRHEAGVERRSGRRSSSSSSSKHESSLLSSHREDDALVRSVRLSACLAAIALPILSMGLAIGLSVWTAMDLHDRTCPDRPAIPVFVQHAPKGEWSYLKETTTGSTLRLSRSNLSMALSHLGIVDRKQKLLSSSLSREQGGTKEEEEMAPMGRKEERGEVQEEEGGVGGAEGEPDAYGGYSNDIDKKQAVILLRDYWPKEVFYPGVRPEFSAWEFFDVPKEIARKLIAWDRVHSRTFRDHHGIDGGLTMAVAGAGDGERRGDQAAADYRGMDNGIPGVVPIRPTRVNRRQEVGRETYVNVGGWGGRRSTSTSEERRTVRRPRSSGSSKVMLPLSVNEKDQDGDNEYRDGSSDKQQQQEEEEEEEGMIWRKAEDGDGDSAGDEAVGLFGMRLFEDPSPETDLIPERLGAQEGSWEIIPHSYDVVVTRGFNSTHDKEECFEAYQRQRRLGCQKEGAESLLRGLIVGIAYAIPFVSISVYMGLLSAYGAMWMAAYRFDHHSLWCRNISTLSAADGPDLEIQSRTSSRSYGTRLAAGGKLRKAGGDYPSSSSSSSIKEATSITSGPRGSHRRLEFLSKRESRKLLAALNCSFIIAVLIITPSGILGIRFFAPSSLDNFVSVEFYSIEALVGSSCLLLLMWTVVCLVYAFAASCLIGFQMVQKHDLGTDSSYGCCC